MWICVDGHGDERIFPIKPHKKFPNLNLSVWWGQRWTTDSIDVEYKHGVKLPNGTIEHFIGKTLTYNDEPVEI